MAVLFEYAIHLYPGFGMCSQKPWFSVYMFVCTKTEYKHVPNSDQMVIAHIKTIMRSSVHAQGLLQEWETFYPENQVRVAAW